MAARTRRNTAHQGNPRWKPGISGNPSGRTKGSKNKSTLIRDSLLSEAQAKNLTPLNYLMSVVMDAKAPRGDRMQAATSCLPYMHARMPAAVSATIENPSTIVAAIQQTLRAVQATTTATPTTGTGSSASSAAENGQARSATRPRLERRSSTAATPATEGAEQQQQSVVEQEGQVQQQVDEESGDAV